MFNSLNFVQLLAQTVTPSPTPTPTPTPSPTTVSDTANISAFLKNTFTSLIGIDILFVMKIVFVWVLLIWLVFAFWVALDALQRYKNPLFALFWFIFVLPFNVFGFIGYLFIRPTLTLEEKEWTKLEAKYLMYELSSVNDCPSCKTVVPSSHNYCPVCGYQMNVTCEKCEHVQSIYNVHCVSCGAKIKTTDDLILEQQAQKAAQTQVSTTTMPSTGEKMLTDISKGFGNVISNFTEHLKKIQLNKSKNQGESGAPAHVEESKQMNPTAHKKDQKHSEKKK